MSTSLTCPYCGRKNFKSPSGLTRHVQSAKVCSALAKEQLADKFGTTIAKFSLLCEPVAFSNSKNHGQNKENQGRELNINGSTLTNTTLHQDVDDDSESGESDSEDDESVISDNGFNHNVDESSNEDDEIMADEDEDDPPVDETLLNEFLDYVSMASKLPELDRNWINAINLLHTLRQTKASLGTYEITPSRE